MNLIEMLAGPQFSPAKAGDQMAAIAATSFDAEIGNAIDALLCGAVTLMLITRKPHIGIKQSLELLDNRLLDAKHDVTEAIEHYQAALRTSLAGEASEASEAAITEGVSNMMVRSYVGGMLNGLTPEGLTPNPETEVREVHAHYCKLCHDRDEAMQEKESVEHVH